MWVGANSESFVYGKVAGVVLMRPLVIQAGISPSSHIEYLVASHTIPLPANNAEYYEFDDASAAYTIISTRLSVNPVSSVQVYTLSGGSFTITGTAVSTINYEAAETEAESAKQTWLDTLGLGTLQDLLDAVYSTLTTLTGVLAGVAGLLSILSQFSTLLFLSGLFAGFNALYVAFAILLAIEDSDDIFRAFGSFMRKMRHLLRFYTEIYTTIKNLIKWW
jgi:hypothetical protein